MTLGLKSALIVAAVGGGGSQSATAPVAPPSPSTGETVVYANDFNGPVGTTYPEWSVATYSWTGNQAETIAPGSGTEVIASVNREHVEHSVEFHRHDWYHPATSRPGVTALPAAR